MNMFSSNGVSCITEVEARLGDVLAKCFRQKNESFASYMEARFQLREWAEANGVRIVSFWDYGETKRRRPELHLVPSHLKGNTNMDTFLVFDDEFATKVLVFGCVP